jgi:hypothetical protein
MAGKLVRNTSTEELRKWWDAVESLAEKARKLSLGSPDEAGNWSSRSDARIEEEDGSRTGHRRDVD